MRSALRFRLSSFLVGLSVWVLSAPVLAQDRAVERLVATLDVAATTQPVLHNLLPSPSPALIDTLFERDPSIWSDVEEIYVRQLEETLEPSELEELADFFDRPLGQAWVHAQGELAAQLLDLADPEPPAELPRRKRAPARRLATALDLDDAAARILGHHLERRQIQRLARFFESPLGQTWNRTTTKIHEGLLVDLGDGSVMRRISTLGCTLAVLAPNLEQAAAETGQDPAQMTPADFEPLHGVIDSVVSLCDCFIGAAIEEAGPDILVQLQEGDHNATAILERIAASGVCVPQDMPPAVPQTARAVREMRDIGTALMEWLTDQLTGNSNQPPPPVDGTGWSFVAKEGQAPNTFTKISAEALAALLVPKYLEALPTVDPWNNPYEFAINRSYLADHVLSIRSAGADGIFDDEPYSVGPFPADSSGHDLVWADGYWVAWPASE